MRKHSEPGTRPRMYLLRDLAQTLATPHTPSAVPTSSPKLHTPSAVPTSPPKLRTPSAVLTRHPPSSVCPALALALLHVASLSPGGCPCVTPPRVLLPRPHTSLSLPPASPGHCLGHSARPFGGTSPPAMLSSAPRPSRPPLIPSVPAPPPAALPISQKLAPPSPVRCPVHCPVPLPSPFPSQGCP